MLTLWARRKLFAWAGRTTPFLLGLSPVLKDSILFPLALAAAGGGMIFAAVSFHRHYARLKGWLNQTA